MPNRIDNGPQQPISTNNTDAAESTDTTQRSDSAQKSDATAGAHHTQDVWEQATTPYGSFMDAPGTEQQTAPEMPVGCEDAADSMAVWEMMCDDSRVSEPEPTDAAFDDDAFDMSENKAARQLAGAFKPSAGESMGPREVRSEFDIQFFQNLTAESRQDLFELAGHTDEFETRLADAIGDPQLAGLVADEVEQRVVRIAGDRIASRARPQLEEVAGQLDGLANDTTERRAFLGCIADSSDAQQEIAQALSTFGVSSDAAEELAEELAELGDDREALRTFVAAEDASPADVSDHRETFEQIDTQFQTEIEQIRAGVESLEREITSNQVSGDRLLTDPNVALMRNEVLSDMGAVIDGDDSNALGEFFLEATADVEAAETRESLAIAAINFLSAAGATALTGGAAAGVIAGGLTGGVQAAPEYAEASQNVDHAQTASNAELTDPELIEQAEREERAAFWSGIASIAVGAVGGGLGNAGGPAPDAVGGFNIGGAAGESPDVIKEGLRISAGTEAADRILGGIIDTIAGANR